MQALLRLSLLLAAFVFSVASGSSKSNSPPPQSGANGGANPGANPVATPPPSRPMQLDAALGLWKTSFGPVKIESDTGRAGGLMGVWVYDRDGQEIVGYFSGAADGNVLNFAWEEPSTGAPLRGAGYLVFDPEGRSFTGRWWTDNRDRGGDWNGWRAEAEVAPVPGPSQPDDFGTDVNGQGGGDQPNPDTYDPSRNY